MDFRFIFNLPKRILCIGNQPPTTPLTRPDFIIDQEPSRMCKYKRSDHMNLSIEFLMITKHIFYNHIVKRSWPRGQADIHKIKLFYHTIMILSYSDTSIWFIVSYLSTIIKFMEGKKRFFSCSKWPETTFTENLSIYIHITEYSQPLPPSCLSYNKLYNNTNVIQTIQTQFPDDLKGVLKIK